MLKRLFETMVLIMKLILSDYLFPPSRGTDLFLEGAISLEGEILELFEFLGGFS